MMYGMQKYVVSTTLGQPSWNITTVIRGNVAAEAAKLKALLGKDILVAGSPQLVNTLMDHDLVDVYRLMVFPVLFGKGKRLFNQGDVEHTLRLVEAKPVGEEGVLTLIYYPQEK